MSKKDESSYIRERVEDHLENNYDAYFTPFLDRRTQAELEGILRRSGEPYQWIGGVPDAERRLLMIHPDYLPADEIDIPVGAFHADISFEAEHRKILGTLMSLGIKRENLGDIQIGEDFIQVVALSRMREYLLMQFTRLQGHLIKGEWLDYDQIRQIERKFRRELIISTSERLDSLIAAMFRTSRSEAQEVIRRGDVQVNWMECKKVDQKVSEGDVLSLRRSGKAKIHAFAGQTKKERLKIEVDFYE